MSRQQRSATLEGRTVLVTGGLGFIGSALARALVVQKVRVRVLDSLLPQSGGSPLNVSDVAERMEIVIEDTRSRDVVDRVVQGCDVIFHFAGQSGPKAFGNDVYGDIDIACVGTLNVLEATRTLAPKARLVFASSYHVYGEPKALPVPETAATEPRTIYGVHKLIGEKYCGVFANAVDTVSARLTTVIGPHQRLQGAPARTVAHVLDCALHGEEVNLRSQGDDLVDLLYVDDAVDALVALALSPIVSDRVVNVGSGRGDTLRDIAAMIISACGRGVISDDSGAVGNGAPSRFVADVTRLRSIGVAPPTRSTEEAIRETVRWFRGGDSDAA